MDDYIPPATQEELDDLLSARFDAGYSQGFVDGRARNAEDVSNLPPITTDKGPIYNKDNEFIGFYMPIDDASGGTSASPKPGKVLFEAAGE